MKSSRIVFVILGLIICPLLFSSCNDRSSYVVKATTANNDSLDNGYLLIDLKGAIKYPNIYRVRNGTILYEIIEMAGGFKESADTDAVNLVMVVNSNQMIMIPEKNNVSTSSVSLININTSSIETLSTLPGIGSSKAISIVNYRVSKGRFDKIEDIKKVDGIGDGLFEKIKEYICV